MNNIVNTPLSSSFTFFAAVMVSVTLGTYIFTGAGLLAYMRYNKIHPGNSSPLSHIMNKEEKQISSTMEMKSFKNRSSRLDFLRPKVSRRATNISSQERQEAAV